VNLLKATCSQMESDVIILAGGLGTRLQHLLTNIPKPMAPINDHPFLFYLLSYIRKFNPKKIILSVGVYHEKIIDFFGVNFCGVEIIYSIENSPLGTGGAILKSLQFSDTKNTFILNGDTFFELDFNKMERQHQESKHAITISVKEMHHFDRYGSLKIANSRIIKFIEKKNIEKGYINAGTYLLNREKFQEIQWPEKFSFETGFLEKFTSKYFFSPFYSEGYFIDIGIPEDYIKVKHDFKSKFPDE